MDFPPRYHFLLAASCMFFSATCYSTAEENEVSVDDLTVECTDLFPGYDELLNDRKEEPFFSFLDEPQRTISKGFAGMTRAIDEFFANENVSYESSGSFIRITIDSVLSEGGNISTTNDFKIRLRLPVTEKKLKLVFESDPEELRNEIDRIKDTPTDDKDKSYFAGLQAELGREDKWRLKPSLGIKLHSPLEYLLRLRGYRNYKLSDKWSLNLSETLYWFNTTGFGADTNIDFNHQFTENVIFRSSTYFRYTDLNDYWDHGQTFSFTQRLSDRRAISYQVGEYGISEPSTHATDYLLLVRYRQNIHADYLFAEIAPQILYQKENDFRAEHSILFRIEMFFRD